MLAVLVPEQCPGGAEVQPGVKSESLGGRSLLPTLSQQAQRTRRLPRNTGPWGRQGGLVEILGQQKFLGH